MSRLISRNPFAREELHRENVKGCTTGCDECGTVKPVLFRYYVEADRVVTRKDYLSGVFCNIACMRSYHAR